MDKTAFSSVLSCCWLIIRRTNTFCVKIPHNSLTSY